MEYDAVIVGQASKTEELESDFTDVRKQTVEIKRHERDLALLDKNLRDLIVMQENRTKSSEGVIK